ncbi:MAG: BNR repeat-containing protein, partial [Rhizomicrobium sp.]
RLGWVQQIGVGPDTVKASDTQIFGVGAFLLAGSEIYRLGLEDARAATVQLQPVGMGYAYNNINTVSMARDALISSSGYQFAFFYGPAQGGQVPLMTARRAVAPAAGADTNRHKRKGRHAKHMDTGWHVVATPFTVPDVFSNSGARDDHNLIAAGIDAKGILHLAWGMHNIPLNYAVSAKPVLGRRFGVKQKLALVRRTMLGRNEEEVTYPEFFHAPDGALMFAYRDGGTGGGSGNGNEYINRLDSKTGHWQRVANPMVDGIASSMNAYLNSFAYGSKGVLFASWTLRETPDWQSNHDLFVARSEDGGKSWIGADGAALGPTITRQSAMAHARILALPQGSSLINQTSMTVAQDGTPLIASWWAPEAGSDNHRREYMLVWPQDHVWQANPITTRGDYEPQDLSSQHVRELARPVVLTDKAGRVLVITRYSAAGKAITDSSNRIRVYWSADKRHWAHIDLCDGNPGSWEPVYDQALWQRQNTLDLFYQPAGLDMNKSPNSTPIAVLHWDETAFFTSIAVP